MCKLTTSLVAALILAAAAAGQAKDAYFEIPLRELKLVEGRLPVPSEQNNSFFLQSYYEREQSMAPYAVLDGPGEAYFSGEGAFSYVPPRGASALSLHLRAPEGQEIKGRLVIANSDRSGMDVLRFVVPASAAKAEAKVPFYHAKLGHYERLVNRDIPGGAWFRHQARLTRMELKLPPDQRPQRTRRSRNCVGRG